MSSQWLWKHRRLIVCSTSHAGLPGAADRHLAAAAAAEVRLSDEERHVGGERLLQVGEEAEHGPALRDGDARRRGPGREVARGRSNILSVYFTNHNYYEELV